MQHRPKALVPLAAGGHREPRARDLDALLGAADPLRHRRLGHKEGSSDLRRGQPADRAERQRDRRRGRQRGMAAEEEQRQRVVAIRQGRLRVGRLARRGHDLAPPARALAAQPVGHPPRRDRDQPARRVVGHALDRPLGRRSQQCLLYGVLRVVDVAVPTGDGPEDLRRQLSQQILDARRLRHCSMSGAPITGRTSISRAVGLPPGPGAADVLAAISIARFSVSTSTSQ